MFKFDLEYYENYVPSCLTLQGIQQNGLTLVEDTSGSVFLFNAENQNITYRINTKPCCEALGYNFDIVNQKCLWKTESEGKNDFKIILNPEGNHGTLFSVDENQTCCLDISFDYMFKFDCADLTESASAITTTTTITPDEGLINEYQYKIQTNLKLINKYSEIIDTLSKTPYVITCNEDNQTINTAVNKTSTPPSAFND